jgi:hypothetical protein
MEAALGEQIVEVEARDPARDLRVTLAYEVCVAVAQVAQCPVDLAAAAVARADLLEFLLAGWPDAHARPVGERDLHLGQVVGGAPGHDRVRAARVVGDHAAERRVRVRGGVGREREVVLGLQRLGELIARHTRLHPRQARLGVDVEDRAHVARGVDDDRRVGGLARQGRARAAEGHRGAVAVAGAQCGDDVIAVDRADHAQRDLAVVGRVTRVRRAIGVVEADLAADGMA